MHMTATIALDMLVPVVNFHVRLTFGMYEVELRCSAVRCKALAQRTLNATGPRGAR